VRVIRDIQTMLSTELRALLLSLIVHDCASALPGSMKSSLMPLAYKVLNPF
jgi:hypothetical protein